MSNLLTKDPLEIASLDAQVYVVHQDKDWRMTLGTLIALVTKATLGLDKVDNTSDAEKPISTAQEEALFLKADKDSVPTLQAFELLAGTLQHYVTTEQLTEAIAAVNEAMQPFLNQQQVASLVDQALGPIVQSLQAFNMEMTGINERIAALENLNLDDVNEAAVNQIVLSALLPVDQKLIEVDVELTSLNETMASLQQTLSNHRHVVADIEGISEYVDGKITVASKGNEW